jgi:hypothetical protein
MKGGLAGAAAVDDLYSHRLAATATTLPFVSIIRSISGVCCFLFIRFRAHSIFIVLRFNQQSCAKWWCSARRAGRARCRQCKCRYGHAIHRRLYLSTRPKTLYSIYDSSSRRLLINRAAISKDRQMRRLTYVIHCRYKSVLFYSWRQC